MKAIDGGIVDLEGVLEGEELFEEEGVAIPEFGILRV